MKKKLLTLVLAFGLTSFVMGQGTVYAETTDSEMDVIAVAEENNLIPIIP